MLLVEARRRRPRNWCALRQLLQALARISFSLSGDSKSARRTGSLPSCAKISAKACSDILVAQALDDLVEEAEVVVELRP